MASRKPVALITGSPNKLQEIVSPTDTVDPASLGLASAPVGLTDTQTLTNKTLTTPVIASVQNPSGVVGAAFGGTGSATNYVLLGNSATASGVVTIEAAGSVDVDVDLNLVPKGAGTVQMNGSDLISATSTTTLSNKTLDQVRLLDEATTHPDSDIAFPVDPTLPSGHAVKFRDEAGNILFGAYKIDGQGATETDTTYLVIRPQTADGSPTTVAAVNLYVASSNANANIRLHPKGSLGRIVQGTSGATNYNLLRHVDPLGPMDRVIATGGFYELFSNGVTAGGQAVALAAPVTGTVYFFPFIRHRLGQKTMTELHIKSGTSIGTGSNCRVAIFANANDTECLPGTLVASSNVETAIPNTDNLVTTITIAGTSMTVGEMYWLGIMFDATSQMVCHAATHPRLGIMGGTAANLLANPSVFSVGYTATWVYGEMTSFTSGSGGWGTAAVQTNAAANFNPRVVCKYA